MSTREGSVRRVSWAPCEGLDICRGGVGVGMAVSGAEEGCDLVRSTESLRLCDEHSLRGLGSTAVMVQAQEEGAGAGGRPGREMRAASG